MNLKRLKRAIRYYTDEELRQVQIAIAIEIAARSGELDFLLDLVNREYIRHRPGH